MKPTCRFRYVIREIYLNDSDFGYTEQILQQWWEEEEPKSWSDMTIKGEWRDVEIEEEK